MFPSEKQFGESTPGQGELADGAPNTNYHISWSRFVIDCRGMSDGQPEIFSTFPWPTLDSKQIHTDEKWEIWFVFCPVPSCMLQFFWIVPLVLCFSLPSSPHPQHTSPLVEALEKHVCSGGKVPGHRCCRRRWIGGKCVCWMHLACMFYFGVAIQSSFDCQASSHLCPKIPPHQIFSFVRALHLDSAPFARPSTNYSGHLDWVNYSP